MAEPKKTPGMEIVEQVLPLVLEIIPGQAADGLIDIYEPGSHEGQTLRKLCERTLNKKDWSIEELQILEDIRRQLEGGRLICRGKPIDGTALDHAAREATEAGEKYLYVPIRAIKPQEGGNRRRCEGRGSISATPAVTRKMRHSEEARVHSFGMTHRPSSPS